MSAQHTPGRLRLFPVGDNLEFLCPATEDGESILTITHEGNTSFAVVLSDMKARRLVACWNACDGVPTELLEAYPAPFSQLRAQRDDMLAALIVAREFISTDRNALADCSIDPEGRMSDDDAAAVADYDKALLQIDAAIQKATGGAA